MSTMNIHYLQHVAFEDPGCILDWARQRGHRVTFTRFHKNEGLPDPGTIDWVIVMGGPMGVYDDLRFPWLRAEKEFIRLAIGTGRTVVGICLGAQLIAGVLGARVYRGPQKEIGWFPVKFTEKALEHRLFKMFPPEMTVFHWHGDTFDLPEGAIPVASSAACKNQGFLFGEKVLGLQFHFEVTGRSLDEMLCEGVGELEQAAYVQPAAEILPAADFIVLCNRQMFLLLDNLAAMEQGKA